MEKVYCGRRLPRAAGPAQVWVRGVPLEPGKSQAIRNHSPDGFQWGYCGSGPAQLALALLLDALSSRKAALAWYQDFKRQVVAGLKDEWVLLQSEITEWYTRARKDDPEQTEEKDDGQETEAPPEVAGRNGAAADD